MVTAERPHEGIGLDEEPSTAQLDLTRFHERSTWVPALGFAVAFGSWIALLATGLLVGQPVVQALLVAPLTLAAGQLFMIGHDAAHGSLTPSRRANEVVGRLAFLPSLHVFGLWRAHHDIHHRYTNLAGRDFVWAPLSPVAFGALPRWRQRLYRFYRHTSGAGLGVHYLLEIWAPRMLWPRRRDELPDRRMLLRDAATLATMVVGLAVLAALLVDVAHPRGSGDPMFWASTVTLLVLVPLLATHWMIGWVVYLNHTHPDIAWFDDPIEWSRHDVQLGGSVGLEVRGTHNLLWPRRIMHHTAHHVDPGVPLRHLGDAQRQLRTAAPDRVVTSRWSLEAFRSVLATCKLYDYRSRSWVAYDTAPQSSR